MRGTENFEKATVDGSNIGGKGGGRQRMLQAQRALLFQLGSQDANVAWHLSNHTSLHIPCRFKLDRMMPYRSDMKVEDILNAPG